MQTESLIPCFKDTSGSHSHSDESS